MNQKKHARVSSWWFSLSRGERKSNLETTTQFKFANSANYKPWPWKTFIPSSPSKIKIFAPLSKWSNLHQAVMLPEIKSSPFCPRCLPYWLTWTPSTLPAFEIVSKQFFWHKKHGVIFSQQFGHQLFFCWNDENRQVFFLDGLWFHFWVVESWHLVSICWIFHVYLLYTLKLQANVPSNVHMHVVQRQKKQTTSWQFVSDQTPNHSSKSNHKVPTIRFFFPQSSSKNIWMFSSASFFLEANGSERHERHERTNQPKKDLEKTAPTQIFVRRNDSTLAVLQRCFSSWGSIVCLTFGKLPLSSHQ